MPKADPAKAGKIVIISGPSGVGKGTLVGNILKRVPNIFLSVSATTRRPRPEEKAGREYGFLTRAEFEQQISENRFLEWAKVYDDYYGTPLAPLERALADGKIVLLEIDTQGAEQVRQQLGSRASYIFIMPPSVDELKRRLVERHTEGREQQEYRLAVAMDELKAAEAYEHVVVNDDLQTATEELIRIIEGD